MLSSEKELIPMANKDTGGHARVLCCRAFQRHPFFPDQSSNV